MVVVGDTVCSSRCSVIAATSHHMGVTADRRCHHSPDESNHSAELHYDFLQSWNQQLLTPVFMRDGVRMAGSRSNLPRGTWWCRELSKAVYQRRYDSACLSLSTYIAWHLQSLSGTVTSDLIQHLHGWVAIEFEHIDILLIILYYKGTYVDFIDFSLLIWEPIIRTRIWRDKWGQVLPESIQLSCDDQMANQCKSLPSIKSCRSNQIYVLHMRNGTWGRINYNMESSMYSTCSLNEDCTG